MVSTCRKILEKIRDAEEKLKSSKYTILKTTDKCMTKRNLLIKEDNEAIEEFKRLKENITESNQGNYSPAYQPVTVKNTGWQDL